MGLINIFNNIRNIYGDSLKMFKVIPLKSGSRQLVRFTLTNSLKTSAVVRGAVAPAVNQEQVKKYGYDRSMVYPRIGNREIVGFGINGHPSYFDQPLHPMPAVRWAEDTAEIAALREKAKGDWSALSVEEKKKLYRADFRSSISETVAPNGEWKFTLGFVLGLFGAGCWLYLFVRSQIYNYPLPVSASLDHQGKMAERMIAEGQGKIYGISSKWDYEKGQWR